MSRDLHFVERQKISTEKKTNRNMWQLFLNVLSAKGIFQVMEIHSCQKKQTNLLGAKMLFYGSKVIE